MTVAELIAALSRFDPDMRVVTPGLDETGIEDLELPYIVDVNGSEAVMLDFGDDPVAHELAWELDDLDRQISRLEDTVSGQSLNGRILNDDQIGSVKLRLHELRQSRCLLIQKIDERRKYAYRLES
jgi:hypothetical protein